MPGTSADRATQRPHASAGNPPPTSQSVSGQGIPVDSSGGPTVDPTKNVLDLVAASITRQDDLREAAVERLNDLASAERVRVNEARIADKLRIDDLAEERRYYEQRIADGQTAQVNNTSSLLANQLDKTNVALTSQIRESNEALLAQIAAMNVNLSGKIADLEKFRWEQGGRSAVADPAMSRALSELTETVSGIQGTRKEGMNATWALIFSVVLAASSLAGLIGFFLSRP